MKLRYKRPDEDVSRLIEARVIDRRRTPADMSDDYRFCAAVASFGMILRGSPFCPGWTLEAVREIAGGALGADPNGYRAEFLGLVEEASELGAEPRP